MSKKIGFLLAIGAIVAAVVKLAAQSRGQMRVVPSVDLSRYAGKWHEIARLPNRFQRKCAADTVATYTVRPDGKLTVVNQCRTAEGRVRSVTGTARPASDTGPNSKLKVAFFWPFRGDYWILDLDPNYRWAVVGEPRRKYLWILSREPRMDEVLYGRLVEGARQQGYNIGPLIRTAA